MRQLVPKLLGLLGVVFVVSVLTFSLVRLLPGDPVVAILGPNASIPERRAEVEEDLGLDRPLVVQYVNWIGGVAQGDLGRSYVDGQRVSTLIRERLPVTIELLILTELFSILVAVPVAIFSAYRHNSASDRAITGVSFAALSFPNFALAVVLVYVFAVELHWVPATGYTPISENLFENLRSVILPVFILSIGVTAAYVRVLRSEMITTLQEDYILHAQAKGLPTTHILFRHALRPSSFSLFTVIALNLGSLIGGSVIVEYIFSLPGIGSLLIQRIGQRDYVVVQAVVLLTSLAFVLANFAVDRLYASLDPRIRTGRVS